MSRQESLIISEELFTALSPPLGNLDFEYVWPVILVTQDMRIQPLIGQALYEKVMNDIKGGSLVDPYKLLVEDYIARTVVWFTLMDGLPMWGIKIVNSGVVQRIVDDSSPLSLTDIDKVSTNCKHKGEFYGQRLIEYLCANSRSFPEYNVCKPGTVEREVQNYSGGLNLEVYSRKEYAKYLKNRIWL